MTTSAKISWVKDGSLDFDRLIARLGTRNLVEKIDLPGYGTAHVALCSCTLDKSVRDGSRFEFYPTQPPQTGPILAAYAAFVDEPRKPAKHAFAVWGGDSFRSMWLEEKDFDETKSIHGPVDLLDRIVDQLVAKVAPAVVVASGAGCRCW